MRAAKIDANQREIVAALRAEPGVTVTILSMVGDGFPDLVVGVAEVNLLVEVKTPHAKLTPRQREWHQGWQGQKAVVHTAGEALRLVRQIKERREIQDETLSHALNKTVRHNQGESSRCALRALVDSPNVKLETQHCWRTLLLSWLLCRFEPSRAAG